MPFEFEERPSDSAFVQSVWRTETGDVERFMSVAVPNWEIVFMRRHGVTSVAVRGPETKASIADCPDESEFFGIQFRVGAFLPDLPPGELVDASLSQTLSGPSFRLADAAWDMPDFENADAFLARLERQGRLVADPVITAVMEGHTPELSRRTVQRRFLRATGLTSTAIRMIERAQRATTMLRDGHSIADVIEANNYADQAHLTRALRRFAGQTPAELSRRPMDMSRT